LCDAIITACKCNSLQLQVWKNIAGVVGNIWRRSNKINNKHVVRVIFANDSSGVLNYFIFNKISNGSRGFKNICVYCAVEDRGSPPPLNQDNCIINKCNSILMRSTCYWCPVKY
jgi:hypothetical protein